MSRKYRLYGNGKSVREFCGVRFEGERGKSRTKSEFAKECDVNFVVSKFLKTGVLSHLALRPGVFGEHVHVDLKSAMDLMCNAQEVFSQLPAKVRKICNNDPAEFIDFVSDSTNIDSLVANGLLGQADADALQVALAKPEGNTANRQPEPGIDVDGGGEAA